MALFLEHLTTAGAELLWRQVFSTQVVWVSHKVLPVTYKSKLLQNTVMLFVMSESPVMIDSRNKTGKNHITQACLELLKMQKKESYRKEPPGT